LLVSAGDTVAAEDLLQQLGLVPALSKLLDRLEPGGVGEGAAAVVAVLTSRGQTATEIASHLFVSKRTVESHLVSVYTSSGSLRRRN
jgi:ATP/maltotriose-dependent transcriptional regulator MalT